LAINNSTSHHVHIGLSNISVSNHILHEQSQNMNGRRNIFTPANENRIPLAVDSPAVTWRSVLAVVDLLR